MINIFYDPHAAGNRNLVTDWRRFDDRTEFIGTIMNSVFDVLLKDRKELVVVDDPFTLDTDDQTFVFCFVDLITGQQMTQQDPVVFFGYIAERLKTLEANSAGDISPWLAKAAIV